MPGELTAPPPVPFIALKDIVHGACDKTLSGVTSYDHARTEAWNSQIISSVLSSLISATTPTDSTQPPYKYSINSTIIQYLPSSSSSSSSTSPPGNQSDPSSSSDPEKAQPKPSIKEVGRRGMHAAAGAYWDNARDGMWSYKYEAAGGKGLDVMVAVIWIWVGHQISNGADPGASAGADSDAATAAGQDSSLGSAS